MEYSLERKFCSKSFINQAISYHVDGFFIGGWTNFHYLLGSYMT